MKYCVALRMHPRLLVLLLSVSTMTLDAQQIDSFHMFDDVRITIDRAAHRRRAMLVLYALPNGNTTEQTIGHLLKPGDDWHYDSQHIGAQTAFIRAHVHEDI